jgi:hypothetical protein
MFPPNQKPESYTLNVHFNGLSHLYAFVKAEEGKMITKYPRLGFVAPFEDRGDVILNHFIWYSNSFLPFIDLFSRAYSPREKLRHEFRSLKNWRNKVSAHFSLVRPKERDSGMMQIASVNQFVTWSNGRFSVGREKFCNVDTGDFTPDNWGWELTEVHERVLPILKRYV